MKRWLLALLCALFIGVSPAIAAPNPVSDVQYNPSTQILSGTTSPNATISLDGMAGSVISDGDGHFTMNVPNSLNPSTIYVIDTHGNQQSQSLNLKQADATANSTNKTTSSHASATSQTKGASEKKKTKKAKTPKKKKQQATKHKQAQQQTAVQEKNVEKKQTPHLSMSAWLVLIALLILSIILLMFNRYH